MNPTIDEMLAWLGGKYFGERNVEVKEAIRATLESHQVIRERCDEIALDVLGLASAKAPMSVNSQQALARHMSKLLKQVYQALPPPAKKQ
jgi:hypothetical protein